MFPRRKYVFIIAFLFVAVCFFALATSAENPSAGKTKKAVVAADSATKDAELAHKAASDAAVAAILAEYPDTEAGRAARAADEAADTAESAAEDAVKAAAEARRKACESGKDEDVKATQAAEKAAREAEAKADAAASKADKADAKADPYGKQLQKKKRDATRRARAAYKAAVMAICFARQCAQLMDESSEANKEKKKETIDTIDGFDADVDRVLALAPRGKGEIKTGEGLTRVPFDTTSGRVTVNLPDDIRAGDTISGTVLAEPKGQNETERSKNREELSRMVVDIATSGKAGPSDGLNVKVNVSANIAPFVFKTPAAPPTAGAQTSPAGTVVIRLTNASGFPVGGTTSVPIELVALHLQSVVPIQVPTMGQQGKPIEIIGPFDGDARNTRLMYGPGRSSVQDFEKNTQNVSGGFGLLSPLAESPRKLVFEAPHNLAGPIEILIEDRLVTPTTKPFREIGVNLSALKTELMRGERTTLTIQVNGLQGITEPVPLTLESHGVITMEGGTFQPLIIQPSQVGADGRYTTTRGITGAQTGAWGATATVVTLPPLILLRDSSPPRQLLFNSQTGHFDFCGGPGEKFSGDGQVKADGCSFHFFQHSNEEVVIGVLNACDLGNRYWVFFGGLASLTVDLRVKLDNANPPRKRIYFNPLNRPAPPVQDTSAFATCP